MSRTFPVHDYGARIHQSPRRWRQRIADAAHRSGVETARPEALRRARAIAQMWVARRLIRKGCVLVGQPDTPDDPTEFETGVPRILVRQRALKPPAAEYLPRWIAASDHAVIEVIGPQPGLEL